MSQEIETISGNETIEQQKMYCKKISMRYSGYTDDVLKLIFSAWYSPEVWEDADAVYKEIKSSFTFLEDELPIVFIGGRSQNKVTRKNQSVGFFITDHTIYVKEASLFTDYLPKKYPFSASIASATETLNQAINSFDWTFFSTLLSDKEQQDLRQFMLEVINDLLTLKKDFNISHHEKEKSGSLSGRMIDLGLIKDSCVKVGTNDKYSKHFNKVYKKFEIPATEPILLAITDATFLGVYGTVITENHVYSKDIMEKTICTKRSELTQNYPISLVEDSIRLGEEVVHTLPTSLDDKEAIKTLLTELFSGELRM